MNGSVLDMSAEESRVFFEFLDSEFHCLVNEYDDDTGRLPGKRRMKAFPDLKAVLNRWKDTQPIIPGTVFVSLENIQPCRIVLSDSERKTCRGVISDRLKRMKKELADVPHGPLTKTLRTNTAVAEKIYRELG